MPTINILHIAAHLGGGVGKAHAALCAATPPGIRRHYVLLEAPKDRRYADRILNCGARITQAPSARELADLVTQADIVQIEWWNHPRLYQVLCATDLPAMRTVFWCHISGLFAPFIPASLLAAGHRFVFTSDCSFEDEAVAVLPADVKARLSAVSSGFGFEAVGGLPAAARHPRRICCLGTLDFVKMSPRFFDVIDAVEAPDVTVSLWGAYDPEGAVASSAAAMKHPDRVVFRGHAADPQAVLSENGIFLYLLQPQHYGTAENALVEAMSLGLVPLVFDHPAEARIVDHGVTGFLESDVASAAQRLAWMLEQPAEIGRIGGQAMALAARTRTVSISAARFADIYRDMLSEEKRVIRFSERLGTTGAQWFLSTQMRGPVAKDDVSGLIAGFSSAGAEAKGSLAHFRASLPGDPSLTT